MNDSSGLIPMADMLSNTVGIMLFILAFTVLHTGGVVIPKRLPMEHDVDKRDPVYFVCLHQRLIPLDGQLYNKLTEGLDVPTYETADNWIAKFNENRAEDGYFIVIPDGKANFIKGIFQNTVEFDIKVTYKPKENVGESIDLLNNTSYFDEHLDGLLNSEKFIYFMVYPDSIEIFRKARDYAEQRYGIAAGWGPVEEDKPILFNLTGGKGIQPTVL